MNKEMTVNGKKYKIIKFFCCSTCLCNLAGTAILHFSFFRNDNIPHIICICQ